MNSSPLLYLTAAILMCSCSTREPSRQLSAGLSFTQVKAFDTFRHVHGGFGEFWMPEIMGSGGGFVDIDGDGWLDVILVGGGSLPSRPQQDVPALAVYKNLGIGADGALNFEEVTLQSGLDGIRAYGFGITAADYDNDGDPDILLTTLEQNLFFLNENGTFREISEAAGLSDPGVWSTSALFFDANKDGHPDLYIANYLQWSPESDIPCTPTGKRDYCNPLNYPGLEDTYYQNNGDGTFTNRTIDAGFGTRKGKGLGVTELDYNNDGWPDLYVANDGQANFLYKNNQDGTFTEVGVTSGVAFDQNGTTRAGMGVDAGVVDSTGHTSLFVGNFSEEMVGVWRNTNNELFTDRAAVSKVGYPTLPTLTFGLSLADLDLDTDLDLVLTNGHVITYISEQQAGVSFKQSPQLFLNVGDGTFSGTAGPTQVPLVGRGLAAGDVDWDGDQDLLITENNGPARLMLNNSPPHAFLRITLEGTESNRNALGARVRVRVPGLTMERRVRTGSSYLSQSEQTVTFGLGDHTTASEIEIQWPSGRIDRFTDIPANQSLILTEGSPDLITHTTATHKAPSDAEVGHADGKVYLTGSEPIIPIPETANLDTLQTYYQTQLSIDSTNVRTHFMYSQYLEQRGNYPTALIHAQKAHALNPDNANYTLVVGSLLFRMGALEQAQPYLEEAVAALPSFYPAQYTIGQLLLQLGDEERAQYHLAQADTARALFQQITQVERAINRFPAEAAYRIQLGELYHQASMYNRAAQAFEAATRLDAQNNRAHFGLGKTMMAQGNTTRALIQYHRVVRSDPTHIDAWLSLGLAYTVTGNCTEARAAWTSALSVDPENVSARNYLNDLCG